MEDLVNLWYQSGKGKNKSKSKGKTLKKSKSKGKTHKQTQPKSKTHKKNQSKSTSTTKSKSKNKKHSSKKYVMDKPIPELMKYPSYKNKYECKNNKCNKDWVKFDKCRENTCGKRQNSKIRKDEQKVITLLSECRSKNCNKEWKNYYNYFKHPEDKSNELKIVKYHKCMNKNCKTKRNRLINLIEKERKRFSRSKQNRKINECIIYKCDKLENKYRTCCESKCSYKINNKSKKKGKSFKKSKVKNKIIPLCYLYV